jgi:hypothetical protein
LVGLRPNGGPVGHMDSERRRLCTRWRSLHCQALRLEAQRRTTGENGSPRGDHPRTAMSLIHVLGGDAHQITPSGTAFVCPHFSIFIHCISRPSAVQREHTKGSTRPRDYLDEPQTIGGPRPSSTPNPACPTVP